METHTSEQQARVTETQSRGPEPLLGLQIHKIDS